jgi:hypothetical protein
VTSGSTAVKAASGVAPRCRGSVNVDDGATRDEFVVTRGAVYLPSISVV